MPCINCVCFIRYYHGLEAALKPANESEKLEIYDAVAVLFPRADSGWLLPLKFIEGWS